MLSLNRSHKILSCGRTNSSNHSQRHIRQLLPINLYTLPQPTDQLWIVTDGDVKKPAIGATLYVSRNYKLFVVGLFRAKLRGLHMSCIPCEIEALSIAVATKHFNPYIIQSPHRACILTDSRPCVMAFEKVCRGECSASPKVSTFLSVISRYQMSIQHLAGSVILPSDFASRNSPNCEEPTFQICSFVSKTEECHSPRCHIWKSVTTIHQ